MLCDETFYDHRKGRYQVREFLERGRTEFGGYDSIVLWHAYPRIGLDNRNQFDFYRDMPGGLAGLREVVNTAHSAGVKVFINYNPWDERTRREGKPDLEGLVEMIVALDADAIFLDTMDRGSPEFRARLDAVRPGTISRRDRIALSASPITHELGPVVRGQRRPGVLEQMVRAPPHAAPDLAGILTTRPSCTRRA
jgi:hypothetical protein